MFIIVCIHPAFRRSGAGSWRRPRPRAGGTVAMRLPARLFLKFTAVALSTALRPAPIAAQQTPSLQHAATLGCDECRDARQFGSILDVDINSKGEVLVVLAKEAEGPVDARLKSIDALQKPPFNSFKSMELLATHDVALCEATPATVQLPNGRCLQIGWNRQHASDGQRSCTPSAEPSPQAGQRAMKPRGESSYRALQPQGRLAARQPLEMAEHDWYAIALR
jgi:hypothetical protein